MRIFINVLMAFDRISGFLIKPVLLLVLLELLLILLKINGIELNYDSQP